MECKRFTGTEREKLQLFLQQNKLQIPLCDLNLQAGMTVYLEDHSVIKGIASLRENAFHPQSIPLYFALDLTQSTYLEQLYAELLQYPDDTRPLQITLPEAQAMQLCDFFARHHFSIVNTSECPQIDLEKSLSKLGKPKLTKNFTLKNYAELTETEAQALYRFRLEGYEKTHYWSPPLSIEHTFWQETQLSAEDQQISWVVFKGPEIVVCSDAHLEDKCVYLGWGWHDDHYASSPDLKELWSTVLRQQLQYCQATGKQLIGEFDATDIYGQYKSCLLTHQTKDTYLIYRQEQKILG